jgi:hypothetical protein
VRQEGRKGGGGIKHHLELLGILERIAKIDDERVIDVLLVCGEEEEEEGH